ncbi:MAG: nitronate monooxygenase [Actinobacteria bacterium]|nr:MAG: nitronate monooxygenase [Actinomycetota bacterium]
MVRLRTPLCDLLNIDYPILSVGFSRSAVPELAAAVSNAGGLGVLGLSLSANEISPLVRKTRELTERPFGGNILVADLADIPDASEADREETRRSIAAAIAERVPVLILFWGDPGPFVAPAHAVGVKLLIQVGSVDEAVAAAQAGVDAVIAQGVEAGGHVKATESIWDVLPRAVEAVRPTPVIASGGIGDGRAIARALQLGAQGVSLGTRFVASEEAWIHNVYKRRLVESQADDTFYGELFDLWWPNAPHRALKRKTYEEWDAAGRPVTGNRPGEGEIIGTFRRPGGDLPWPRYASGMLTPDFDGEPEYAPMWAGTSVDAIDKIQPAAAIIEELVAEAEAALA